MSNVTLQIEYVSEALHYGSASYHPRHTRIPVWENDTPRTIYPTESQCERFALRIERLIRKQSEYLDLSSVRLRINLDTGDHHITHDLAYPGQYGSYSVYEANRRFIAHEYPETGIIMGGIAYMPLTMETIELIAKLDGYPVFDDEFVSEVEIEQQEEYVKDDLVYEIGRLLENMPHLDTRLDNACLFDVLHIIDGDESESDVETPHTLYDDMTPEQQVDLLYEGMADLGCYPDHEGNYAYMHDRNQIKLAEWVANHLTPRPLAVPTEQLPLFALDAAA